MFQGFTATALRDAPYAGIYVVFYEEGKEIAGEFSSTHHLVGHTTDVTLR